MKIGVLVLEGPYQHQAADSAYHFVKAALERGHDITGIFLYTDGVNNANGYIKPPGERNIAKRFSELAEQGIDVIACTACARFRGFRRDMLADNVSLGGLGALAEYLRASDRFITFGD
jgi:tRNA 2-thiouridine synthesizing protein D